MSTQRPDSQMTCSIPRGRCSDLHTDTEAQGVSAAACSASLKANGIDSSVWDVQPHPLLFLVHPPSFLSSLPFILSTPSNFPRSPRRFCQAGCKTVSEQLFGKQQLGGKQRREGSHGSSSSLPPLQERPQTLSSSLWIVHSSNWNNLQELCVLPS